MTLARTGISIPRAATSVTTRMLDFPDASMVSQPWDLHQVMSVALTPSEIFDLFYSGQLVKRTINVGNRKACFLQHGGQVFHVVLCRGEYDGRVLCWLFSSARCVGSSFSLLRRLARFCVYLSGLT